MSKTAARYDKHELERIQGLHASGKVEKAIGELRALAHSAPTSRALRAKLVDWLQRAGQKDDAIAELFKLQELLVAQGDMLAAISAGLKIVELDPQFDNPLSYVAKVNADRMIADQEHDLANQETDDSEEGDTQGALQEIPLLSELSSEELAPVALSMKRRLLHGGAVVFEEGDTSQTLCFVVKGALQIQSHDKTLDTILAGQCLGEFAFLTGEPRSATVIAREDSEILELSAGSMQAVVKGHPRIGEVLETMYQGRVLARVLADSPLFGFMSSGERHRVASRFELLKVRAGEAVFHQGDEEGALYLVKRGSVAVRTSGLHVNDTSKDVPLGSFGPNEFFGEVSFLTGVPRTASIDASEDSELLRIDRDALNELTGEYPRLTEILKKFHVERVMEAVQTAKSGNQ